MIREPFIASSAPPTVPPAGLASFDQQSRRARLLGLGVLVFCLLLCLVAWSGFHRTEARALDHDLQHNADRYLSVLRIALSAEERLLRGAAGLIVASEQVTQQEWRGYVDSLSVLREGSGILAMGYAQFDAPRPGDPRREMTPALVASTESESAEAAIADFVRSRDVSAAVEAAVESGHATLVEFGVGDRGRAPGFWMLLPVFPAEPLGIDRATTRRMPAGVVFVQASLARFMQASLLGLDEQQQLRVFALAGRDTRLLFDSLGGAGAGMPDDVAVTLRAVNDYGLNWSLEFSRHADPSAGVSMSTVVAAGGLIASLLLAFFVWHQALSRQRAEQLAFRMTGDLRRSEAGLARSQALLRGVLDGLPSGVLVTDTDFKVTFANRTVCDMVGHGTGEVVGHRVREFVDPSIAHVMEVIDRQVLEIGEDVESEIEIADPSGKPRSYHVRKVLLRGDRPAVLALYTDITTLRDQAREVEHYQNVLEQLFETIPHPLYVKDDGLRYVRVNRRFAEQIGIDAAEIIGRRAVDLLSGETAREAEAQDLELLERGGSGEWNWVLTDVRGNRREMVTAKSLLRDDRGSCFIVGVNTDVSALRGQARTIRALIDHLPQKVYIKDGESRYLVVNRAYAEDLGLSPDEVVGRRDIDFFAPELARQYCADDRRIMETGQSAEYEERYAAGWLRMSKVPLRDENGTVVGVVGVFEDITERREQEERLRASEARWQFALEGSGDGVWDWDVVGNRVDFSSRWKSMLGYRDDEIGGVLDEWSRRVHPGDLEGVLAEVQRHLRGETAAYSSEHRLLCSNGEYKWILDRGKVVARDEFGKPVRMIGTHTDISERKRVELTLAESEARFRLLADSAPNLIWLAEGVEGRGYFNRTWLEFTGASIDSERGAGWMARLHPDDTKRFMSIYEAAFEDRERYEVEFRLCRHDGAYRWMLETGVPRFDRDGAFAGFIGSCIDITERREFEIEVRRNRDLLDAINGLQEDFIHAPDTNLAFERMLGWLLPNFGCEFGMVGEALTDGDTTYLRTLAVSKIVWDEEFGLFRQENASHTLEFRDPGTLFGAVLATDGEVISNDTGADARARRLPPGHPEMFNFAGLPVRNGSELLGMVGLANREGGFDAAAVRELEPLLNTFGKLILARRSERARKLAESELARHRDHLREMVEEQTAEARAARDDAQRANRVKSEFLANMSHELRTPMHAILSFAKLGQGRALKEQQDKLHDYFDRIHLSGDRLLNLLNDLLDLSKLEAGKMVLDVRVCAVSDLVRDAVTEFEAMFQSKGVALRVTCDPDLPRVQLDWTRVGQVLRNLLSNAAKFTPAGRAVEVRAARCALPHGLRGEDAGRVVEGVEIVVSDEGIGIPDTELEHVFDKFVQSSKTRTGAGGTGLGLAITREIVGAHGGSILARHNDRGGTDFVVRLPAKPNGPVNSVSAIQR